MKAKTVNESLNEFERGVGINKTLGIGREEFALQHFGIGNMMDRSDLPSFLANWKEMIKFHGMDEYKGYWIFTWENIKGRDEEYERGEKLQRENKSYFVSMCDPDLNPDNKIPNNTPGSVEPFMTDGNTKELAVQEMKDGLDSEIAKYK